jgi:hypothetical protein
MVSVFGSLNMKVARKNRLPGRAPMQEVEIRVRGQINKNWSDYFGELAVFHTLRGETVLTGPVADQAELRGILTRLADLGLELISVSTTHPTEKAERESTNGGDVLEK